MIRGGPCFARGGLLRARIHYPNGRVYVNCLHFRGGKFRRTQSWSICDCNVTPRVLVQSWVQSCESARQTPIHLKQTFWWVDFVRTNDASHLVLILRSSRWNHGRFLCELFTPRHETMKNRKYGPLRWQQGRCGRDHVSAKAYASLRETLSERAQRHSRASSVTTIYIHVTMSQTYPIRALPNVQFLLVLHPPLRK